MEPKEGVADMAARQAAEAEMAARHILKVRGRSNSKKSSYHHKALLWKPPFASSLPPLHP